MDSVPLDRPLPAQAAGRILVVQHVECEPPATYEDVLIESGYVINRVQLGDGDLLPALEGHDAVISMGGPMGALDVVDHPWLREETSLLAQAVRHDVPVWGVCLGAQILAAALGSRVYVGTEPEVGMSSVALTEEGSLDPVFSSLPDSFPVFQWHGDTFTLPASATCLVTSLSYENQAFCSGSAYAIQFHVEVTENLAAEWAAIPEYEAALESIHGPGSAARMLDELRENADVNARTARTIFSAWLDNFVKRSTDAPLNHV